MHYLRIIEIRIKTKIIIRTHRKSNTENPEQKKTHQLHHDRPDLLSRTTRSGCQSPTVRVTLMLGLGWFGFKSFGLLWIFVGSVLSDEPRQNQGRGGLVDRKLVKAPPPPPPSSEIIFIAGRPKAVLLVWLFSDFRCGVPLYIYIGHNRCQLLD